MRSYLIEALSLCNLHRLNDNVFSWAVHAVGLDLCQLSHNFLGSWVGDLTEDGVVVVEVWGWCHGDEELGTIGARTSVCHSQQVWTVEGELWVELILELVARATTAGAGWVAALDHEVINNAVEDSAVVERAGLLALSVLSRVFLLTGCEADKVFNSYWCVVTEQVDDDVTEVGVQRCSCSLLSHDSHCKQSSKAVACVPGNARAQRSVSLLSGFNFCRLINYESSCL